MKYINQYCADVGTSNCPCPLAETGDCLICSRLAGKETCDCMWAGLCIYNEYIQNGGIVRNRRQDQPIKILKKTWYDDDLLTMTLEVGRGMALTAAKPGSFVFLRPEGKADFCNVPVSIMASDMQNGRIHLALKVISAKTKLIAQAEDSLILRGIYRNGLLGEGLEGLEEDVQSLPQQKARNHEKASVKKSWLILTKGVGFAPAVNLLRWADDRVDVQMAVDMEKISRDMVNECIYEHVERSNLPEKMTACSLQDIVKSAGSHYDVKKFDRVFILASDYYIKTISEAVNISLHKLIFSNNFHMCCGEGICGACGHTDADGNFSKMCKCRNCTI